MSIGQAHRMMNMKIAGFAVAVGILLGGTALPSLTAHQETGLEVEVIDITHRIVTITWQTEREATSQVVYGVTPAYGHTASNPGMTRRHRVIVAGLAPETTYHFRALSVDDQGRTTISEDRTFTTRPVPDVPEAFPADFSSPIDATTGRPLPGFGGGPGVLYHDPIIFVHGNGETALYWRGLSYAIPRLLGRFLGPEPIPGGGTIQPEDIIARFIDEGYTPAELWALSYLGHDGINDGRDLIGSSFGHSHEANTPDVGAFIEAVLDYTGAAKVDIIAHSLGVTLVRDWIRRERDRGHDVLSRLDDVVFIAGPNHGTHFCGFPFIKGTEPASLVTLCEEVGRADSPFLRALNADETPQVDGRPRYMTLFAAGPSEDFAFPAEGIDSLNRPVNLRLSPVLKGALNVGLAFELPPDPRFPVVFPTDLPLEFGDPRAHYLLGVSEEAFQVYFPFVSDLRE
ncbi:MAG: hypothetical protein D6723_15810 [Acidobacteria bacterium]|nr:MAG: hypothetical protein D6723_15810 [Acidobacteriota bacterium]